MSAALTILYLEIMFFNLRIHRNGHFWLKLVIRFPARRDRSFASAHSGDYSRLCFTLFALVYVTQDKAQRGI